MKELAIRRPFSENLLFWILMLLATVIGELAGDVFLIDFHIGNPLRTCIFAIAFIVFVALQIKQISDSPYIYWGSILLSTALGLTIADFVDDFLGYGYTVGGVVILLMVIRSMLMWKWENTIDPLKTKVKSTEVLYYWLAILFSQSLGSELGEWSNHTAGIGQLGTIYIFGLLLLCIFIYWQIRRYGSFNVFWLAFIFTRPIGAAISDFLSNPVNEGGLALSRASTIASLITSTIIIIYLTSKNRSVMPIVIR